MLFINKCFVKFFVLIYLFDYYIIILGGLIMYWVCKYVYLKIKFKRVDKIKYYFRYICVF